MLWVGRGAKVVFLHQPSPSLPRKRDCTPAGQRFSCLSLPVSPFVLGSCLCWGGSYVTIVAWRRNACRSTGPAVDALAAPGATAGRWMLFISLLLLLPLSIPGKQAPGAILTDAPSHPPPALPDAEARPGFRSPSLQWGPACVGLQCFPGCWAQGARAKPDSRPTRSLHPLSALKRNQGNISVHVSPGAPSSPPARLPFPAHSAR